MQWAAFAPEGVKAEIDRELTWRKLTPVRQIENLYLFDGDYVELFWSQVQWKDCAILTFTSISDGVKQLKQKSKMWMHVSAACHRRGELIAEQLRIYKNKPLEFPGTFNAYDGGGFCLLDNNEILFSTNFNRPNASGINELVENKAAPSRAYLKLEEALGLLNHLPQKNELAVDFGACPGGWTWVLDQFTDKIIAIDRSPLHPGLQKPSIQFIKGDVFANGPAKLGNIDWFCCDVICYPEKLLEFVQTWIAKDAAKYFICTLKFQGEANFATIEAFAKIGHVRHLHNNKHELTWWRGFNQS